MPDATERGGALAAVYRAIKNKDSGVIRIDRETAMKEAERASKAKTSNPRNKPMANVQSSGGKPKV